MTAFIFDLDGTIHDSVPTIVGVLKKVYEHFGKEITEEEIKSYIGVPLAETSDHFLGPGHSEKFVQTYMSLYESKNAKLKPFVGADHMLAAVKAAGAKLAIATAKRRKMTIDTLTEIGLLEYFDFIVDSESTTLHKPHPEPAFLAMEKLGATKEESYFIGDSVHDLMCGRNAGIKAVAVTWGAGTKEALAGVEPEYTVDTMQQLEELLLSFIV